MKEKTIIKILWVIIIALYLTFPFGKWLMLSMSGLSLIAGIATLIRVKNVNIEAMNYWSMFIMEKIHDCRHDVVTWLLVAATVSSTLYFEDYYVSAMIVLTLFFELEVFKVAKRAVEHGVLDEEYDDYEYEEDA